MSRAEITTVADWLGQRGGKACQLPPALTHWALMQVEPTDSNRELALTLSLLDRLGADADTVLAAVLFTCAQNHWAAPTLPSSAAVSMLLQGQAEAEKVWPIYYERGGKTGAEGLRRLLLAIIRDLRVVLILLARQLARMRAAAALPEEIRRALAQLSADIHAPLANRLGIWQLKWELEDLAFRYLQPDTYRRIASLLDEKRGDRESFIEEAKSGLREALLKAGIRGDVAGRRKHIFSIWKKIQRKDVRFSDLYDIRAVRVLVDDIATCYAARVWRTVCGRRSPANLTITSPTQRQQLPVLHTAVIGPQGKTLEIQIRTHDMHAHAELGVAAHWRYRKAAVAMPSSSARSRGCGNCWTARKARTKPPCWRDCPPS